MANSERKTADNPFLLCLNERERPPPTAVQPRTRVTYNCHSCCPHLFNTTFKINDHDDCSSVAPLDSCRVRPVLLGESALSRSANPVGRRSEERGGSRSGRQQGGRDEGYRRLRAARLCGSPELMGSHDPLGLRCSDGQGHGSGRGGHEPVCLGVLAHPRGLYSFLHLHRDPHYIFLPDCCFHGGHVPVLPAHV